MSRELRTTLVIMPAVLILAAMPLLAVVTFGAPAAQTLQPVTILPLVMGAPYYPIAFVSTRDGNSEIYLMNADGSRQTNLTNNPSDDRAPVWAPSIN